MREAYIIEGKRSAIGKSKRGGFRNMRSDDLAVRVIKDLVASIPGLDPKQVDDVIVGCANPEGEQGLQIGRNIAARALGKEVPGFVINRYCASGLEAIGLATAKIRAGMAECIIAGGAESMSLIPMTGYKMAPSYEAAMENLNYHVSMGATAEAVAKKWEITREQADAFSVRSHQLAAAAIEGNKFYRQIVPIEVEEVFVKDNKRVTMTSKISIDEGVRKDTTLEALGKLPAVFKNGGIITAGNSSQTSDGAAFVVVMSDAMANKLGLKPKANLISCSVAGVDPLYMGIGPCAAIPRALAQAGKSLSDIHLVELNEAFAAQALAVIKEAGLNPDIVNVNGGAVALGHPLGCTGAKLSIQIFDEIKARGQKYGMVTACVGGGQGIAGIYEVF
jgi:acetyl-CoA acyltransferase